SSCPSSCAPPVLHPFPTRRSSDLTDWFPFSVTMFAVVVIILLPMITLLERSFITDDGYGFDNYRLLVTSSGSGFAGGTTAAQALVHSLKIALDGTLITLIAAMLISLIITRAANQSILVLGPRYLYTLILLSLDEY